MRTLFDAPFAWWLAADWPLALAAVLAFHLVIYLVGGVVASWMTFRLFPALDIGHVIDNQPLKPKQIRTELRNGLLTCAVLAVVSLAYRPLAHGIWPETLWQAAWQLGAFVLFNNVYAYATHRLLHHPWLMRFHSVHHWSVRVTPWSGYSVHPVEAAVIGGTFVAFMAIVPVGVGTIALLHVMGIVFTSCIHCNHELMPMHADDHWLKRLVSDPKFHQIHHEQSRVNYGFTSPWLDRLLNTLGR
ncbi:MAG: sterol desaturase family protein [Rhizobacter sp.]|nr:sterol desaturase family protein [Rhizobacter sp.]